MATPENKEKNPLDLLTLPQELPIEITEKLTKIAETQMERRNVLQEINKNLETLVQIDQGLNALQKDILERIKVEMEKRR